MSALADDIGAEQRVLDLQRQNETLQRQLARAKHKSEDLVDAVHRGARDAAVIVGTPNPIPRPPADRRKADEEVALAHVTDWQLGKETESYSSDIAEERVRSVIAKVCRLTDIQRADHPVKRCVLMLGGDLIEGTSIFPTQAWEVDSEAFSQVFRAAALVEQAILTLLGHFDHVEVYEAHGNHGRIGRKGESPRGDNWDRVVGRIARDRLAQQRRRLTWHDMTQPWHSIVQIGNYKALLVHGDQVKSFGGQLPAYGVMKKAAAWASGVVEPFQDVYLGHYHSAFSATLPNGGRVFMTPSIESGSEYAREFVAAKGRPGQRLHFVEPKRGRISAEYVIWV